MTRYFASLCTLAAALLLSACASNKPAAGKESAPEAIKSIASSTLPDQWQTGLPHGGSVAQLAEFWTRWRDPLLVELVTAAQKENATLAQAASRVAQARATRTAAGAELGPTLDAQASATRARQSPGSSGAPATSLQAGLQAAWEIDVFGGNLAARDAAQARLDSAQANWHDARVLVAAEVAVTYLNHRFCLAQSAITETDTQSREATQRLTDLTARAGLTAPATAQLAQASAAESRQRLTEQRAACDVLVKELVALSGVPEPALREKIKTNTAPAPDMAALAGMFSIAAVPAQVIAQRPDVLGAEREVLASAADVKSTEAQRLPRIALNGSIGGARVSSGGTTADGLVWSLGPISVSLPLFDGGRRAADVEASRARYDEATAAYRGKLRTAVREVEESLVNLQSTSARAQDVQLAANGYRANFIASEQRYKAGLGSLVELEDARRTALSADNTMLTLQRDRIAAWISLYRAAGGGFTPN
jgi:outer membrane protein, multidrug efflux system